MYDVCRHKGMYGMSCFRREESKMELMQWMVYPEPTALFMGSGEI